MSSHLQCDDGQGGQNDTCYPEAYGDFRLVELVFGPALQDVAARGIKLGVELPEIVMDGRSPEYAHALSLALHVLEVGGLYDDAQALHQEYATQDGEQQFLVYDDGPDTYDAADGQRSRVSHEHLGRIGIVPEEAYHGSHEGTQEHH